MLENTHTVVEVCLALSPVLLGVYSPSPLPNPWEIRPWVLPPMQGWRVLKRDLRKSSTMLLTKWPASPNSKVSLNTPIFNAANYGKHGWTSSPVLALLRSTTSSSAINKYIMSDILTITEGSTFDESLQEYQVREYETQAGANLNNPGEIRINKSPKICSSISL